MKKTTALLFLAAGTLMWQSCKQAKDSFIEGMLQKQAEEFNKTGGKMVDQETRLDSLGVKPGKCLVYYYTSLNYAKGDLDSIALKKNLRPAIRKTIATKSELATLRKQEVSFEYTYYDKNGQYWFSVPIKPKDYQKQ